MNQRVDPARAQATAAALAGDASLASGPPRRVPIRMIQGHVASHYGVALDDLLSARRTAKLVRPRWVAMYLAKAMTARSLPTIGRCFGGRDHTTVFHAVGSMQAMIEADAVLAAEVAGLRRRLEEAA